HSRAESPVRHPAAVSSRRFCQTRGMSARPAMLTLLDVLLLWALPSEAPAQILSSGQLGVERRGHTATLLGDGRILVVGGEDHGGVVTQSELMDPMSGIATAGPASDGRTDHSAILLADGRVLIAGGQDPSGRLATTQIYDPAANAFTAGPGMTRAR